MRVFQTTYKDADHVQQKASKWYVELRDHAGKIRRLPGFTDRKLTEALGRNVERLVRFKVAGEALDPALTKWVEGLPRRLWKVLARHGLLAGCKLAALRPLVEHLNGAADAPGFRQYLTAKANTPGHVALTVGRVRRIVDACGFTFWSDVSAAKVQAFLHSLRQDRKDAKGKVKRGIGLESFNHHLRAFKGFCKWMVNSGRASENPVAHLSTLNAKVERRHDRRALAVEEVRALLAAASGGPERCGMAGGERAMLYRLAVETGLRAGELSSLTRASFVLDDSEPRVVLLAAYSKHRREDTLPLRPDTAAELRAFLATKAPAAPVFNVPRGELAEMLKLDLADAREAWLKAATTPDALAERTKTAFLLDLDTAGRVVDFHALRHTFITALASSGVAPKTAQSLARHSTITLTMDRYTHSYIGDERAALDLLPSLDPAEPQPQAARATGTDHQTAAGATDAQEAPPDAPRCPRTGDAPHVRPSAPPAAGDGASEATPKGDSRLALYLALSGGRNEDSLDSTGRQSEICASSDKATNAAENAVLCGKTRPERLVRPAGLEPTTDGLEIHSAPDVTTPPAKTSEESPEALGALLGASGPATAPLPPDLAAVVKAWPTLPDALKAGIVAVVKACPERAEGAAGDSPKA